MYFSQGLDLNLLFNSFINLSTAFILGSIIGYERQYRQRTAGLRTNTLVSLAAAVFVGLAYRLNGPGSAAHVAAYVVSGVGFLGAGTIMKEGLNVRGLNTAATLWGSAAVGACAGAGMIIDALMAAVFVLAANTLLRPVVNAINRTPINDQTGEVSYQICMIVDGGRQKHALSALESLLEQAQYPLGDIDVEPFGDDAVEITATLLSASVDSGKLDALIAQMAKRPYIKQAFWNLSAAE